MDNDTAQRLDREMDVMSDFPPIVTTPLVQWETPDMPDVSNTKATRLNESRNEMPTVPISPTRKRDKEVDVTESEWQKIIRTEGFPDILGTRHGSSQKMGRRVASISTGDGENSRRRIVILYIRHQ